MILVGVEKGQLHSNHLHYEQIQCSDRTLKEFLIDILVQLYVKCRISLPHLYNYMYRLPEVKLY